MGLQAMLRRKGQEKCSLQSPKDSSWPPDHMHSCCAAQHLGGLQGIAVVETIFFSPSINKEDRWTVLFEVRSFQLSLFLACLLSLSLSLSFSFSFSFFLSFFLSFLLSNRNSVLSRMDNNIEIPTLHSVVSCSLTWYNTRASLGQPHLAPYTQALKKN